MANALVVSIALSGFERLYAGCIATQRAYCERCGYRYALVNRAPRRLRPIEASWIKVPLIKAALEVGYGWVFFIDADVEIRPHTPCLVDYLDDLDSSKAIYVAPGHSGRINAGVICARRHPDALAFFSKLIEHADLNTPKGLYENGVVIHFGTGNPAIGLLDHRMWNNNSYLDESSYLQHYTRGPLRDWYIRNRLAGGWLRLLMRKLAKRYVPKGIRQNGLLGEPVVVSKSLAELTPYFAKTYAEFRSAVEPASGN